MEDSAIISSFLIGLLFGIVLASVVYIFVVGGSQYKQGQLDYQAGKIEWTLIDGKLHHIQKP